MTTKTDGKALVVRHPDPSRINAIFAPAIKTAAELQVTDAATAKEMGEALQALKGAEKFLLKGDPAQDWEGFDAPVKAAFEGHRFLTKLRDMALDPYRRAYKVGNDRLLAWEEAERKKAEEEARRREEEARKAEEERALLDAVAAEEAGDSAAAEEILAEPVSVPMVAPAAPAKIEGRSTRKVYTGRVRDLLKLVRHVAEHPEDLAVLSANTSSINARARSQRECFNLPGCELVVEKIASTRTG